MEQSHFNVFEEQRRILSLASEENKTKYRILLYSQLTLFLLAIASIGYGSYLTIKASSFDDINVHWLLSVAVIIVGVMLKITKNIIMKREEILKQIPSSQLSEADRAILKNDQINEKELVQDEKDLELVKQNL
ncbi:MAG: hypothetical protein V1859_04860 [archaeon]